MNRFRFAVLWFGLALNPAFAAHTNVVFILADDLGWTDTTLYGQTNLHRTPNLERLAKRGLTFTRAHSASPLCSPTRSAILTGLSPARTGITTPNAHEEREVLRATAGTSAPRDQKSIQPNPPTRLLTEYRTIAESLREAGYATGHFGKWHLGPAPYSPLQQGFDVDVPHHAGPGPAGSYVAPWKFKDFDPDPGVPDQHIEDRMAREASAWMERHRDRPFFLNYWMFSVHAPFDAKRALVEKYRGVVDSSAPQRCPTYAAMVESMDDAVGTLLDTLDRLGLSDNTVIIFTSDNGGNMYNEVDGAPPTSNLPLRGGKATLFEGGTRVPAVVVWPGRTTAGSRSDVVIQSEDYYPTLLAGLGIPPAPGQLFDGVSLLPVLHGGASEREAVFQYFPHSPPVPDWLPPAVSVIAGDWKLIRIFHGGDQGRHRYKLFHLGGDPGEMVDLAAQFPAKVGELDARITRFLADTAAVVPVRNPAFDPAAYRPELEGQAKPRGTPRAAAPGKSAVSAEEFPGLLGWKARNGTGTVRDGVLRMDTSSGSAFLGVSSSPASGAATLTARLRAAAGKSRVEWLPAGPGTQGHDAPFTLPGGDWTEIAVPIPATGPLGVVRLHLPAQADPVEVDWIELRVSGQKARRWDF